MTRIVVGVDGSAGASLALRWAARESTLRNAELTAVMAWGYLDQHHAIAGTPFDPSYREADALAALVAAIDTALDPAAAAAIDRRVVCDLAAPALLDMAASADLLVVGARGLGGFRGLLLGSVSDRCVTYSPCAVAVVRPTTAGGSATRGERVVVGIDGSDASGRALQWAVEEAAVRRATLQVVHAWGPRSPESYGREEAAAATAVLDAAVDRIDTSGLVAPVERHLTAGPAATSLIEAAGEADVLVVGSRGLGGFEGLLLGSVSHQVAHHAPCPVVVVPSDRDRTT